MQHTIPKDMKYGKRLYKFIYLKDVVFILCLFFISYLLSDLVHVYLRTIWNIFSLVLGIILSMHSPNNPKKKIYNSVYYTLKRKNTYKPISTKGD